MAEETAFGLSFGDPRKYMGKSPLADVGQAIKTGLIGYGIQKSGLESWLNEKGMSKAKQGGYEYKPPVAGAAVPTTPMAAGPVAPIAPPQADMAAMAPGAVPPAVISTQPTMPPVNMGPPPDIGMKILDDTWESSAAPEIQKQDFNPLAPDTSNQMAASGMDYQKVPGYGKLAKMAQMFGGMG